jgi:hypothetical protein
MTGARREAADEAKSAWISVSRRKACIDHLSWRGIIGRNIVPRSSGSKTRFVERKDERSRLGLAHVSQADYRRQARAVPASGALLGARPSPIARNCRTKPISNSTSRGWSGRPSFSGRRRRRPSEGFSLDLASWSSQRSCMRDIDRKVCPGPCTVILAPRT